MFAFIHEKTQPDKTVLRRNIDPSDIINVASYGGTTSGVTYREKGSSIVMSAEVLETATEVSFWRSLTDTNAVSALSPAVSTLTLAALGAAQGAGAPVTKYFTVVTTATASSADGVLLPAAVVDDVKIIRNDSAATIKIYPATGERIDGGTVNAAITLVAGATISLYTKENAALGYFTLR